MSTEHDHDRLAAFFHNSPDAVVVVDEAGTIVRANERVRDVFGYEPAELEGNPVERLVPRDVRDEHPDLVEGFMAEPERRPMGAGLDLEARRKDGSTVPVDISLSPIERADGLEVIAAVRDVSERQRLRRKYRTLVEIAPDAVFVADAETGEILEVNRRATELMEEPADALVGRDQTTLHPSEDRDRYRDLFRRHVGDERVTEARFEDGDDIYVETATGERVPIEISAQVTRIEGREVVMALFRDVSERKAYERDLHRQIDRLETLAHVLSHDLRNPLNVAMGGVEMAKRSGELDRLDPVERAHDRIADIIDDVLTMVRDGYEVERLEPVELASLVSECWATVATDDASVRVDRNGLCYADPGRVRNLFENLFRNAVEHAGPDVTVRVRITEEGFVVGDDGPGIPESEREEVFDPGWTTESDGTGLGLNIVSEIAAAHDWSVAAGESESGGAAFRFTGVRTSVFDESFRDEGDGEDGV
ncbi:MAG: PAS domain S-box protein [Halosimplex sp.]